MNYVRNILTFVILLILQVIIFNKFTLGRVATPHVYLVFLLMLPMNLRFSFGLLIGFFAGFLVDLFSSGLMVGISAFSCVLMMSLRDFWIKVITTKISFRGTEDVFLTVQPIQWYLNYLFPLILVHHLAYYYLEAFGFANFGFTFLKILSSSVYTFIFCLIFTLLIYNKSGRR